MVKASDNVYPRFLISEGGSTSTPASGRVTMYAKADGLLYSKDDAGTETLMSGVASGSLIASKEVPTGTNYSTTSASYVDIDATNVAITFTVPASGSVMTQLTAAVGGSAGSDAAIAVHDGTSQKNEAYTPVSTVIQNKAIVLRVTGLTPAASVTLKWQYKRASGTLTVYRDKTSGYSGGPASIMVFSV